MKYRQYLWKQVKWQKNGLIVINNSLLCLCLTMAWQNWEIRSQGKMKLVVFFVEKKCHPGKMEKIDWSKLLTYNMVWEPRESKREKTQTNKKCASNIDKWDNSTERIFFFICFDEHGILQFMGETNIYAYIESIKLPNRNIINLERKERKKESTREREDNLKCKRILFSVRNWTFLWYYICLPEPKGAKIMLMTLTIIKSTLQFMYMIPILLEWMTCLVYWLAAQYFGLPPISKMQIIELNVL